MFSFHIQDNLHIQKNLHNLEIFHILDFYMNLYTFLYQAFHFLEIFPILEKNIHPQNFPYSGKFPYCFILKLHKLDPTGFIKLMVYAFLGKNKTVLGSPQVSDERIL